MGKPRSHSTRSTGAPRGAAHAGGRTSFGPSELPAALRDASRGVRLQKALANAGLASRRAAETMIEEGRVAVNGITISDLPVWVDPQQDRITVDGRPAPRPKRGRTYLLVNKPRNIICTNDDELGRRNITDLVPHTERLFCVGRLDADSQGMVILTDDGDLTQQLTHPSHEVPKTYMVTVKGYVKEADMPRLQRGVVLTDKSGKPTPVDPDQIQIIARDRDRTKLKITLTEGRNREIRRLLARIGYDIHRLKRIAVGPIPLKGVGIGQWRELTPKEVAALRKAGR